MDTILHRRMGDGAADDAGQGQHAGSSERRGWSRSYFQAALFAITAILTAGFLLVPAFGEDRFSLAIVPDVQLETGDSRLHDRLQWLVEQRSTLNLKMVLFSGDTMNFNLEDQYRHQSESLKVLEAAGLPFAVAIGNHDTAAVRVDGGSAAPGNVNANLRDTSRFNKWFPVSRSQCLKGVYEAGKADNAYHTFQAGGLNWLVINLELWARTGAVEWARKVVEDHPHHNVIFVTHAHLNSDSSIQQNNGGYGDNSPQYIFDRAIKPFPNVRLVFSGHVGSHGYRMDQGTLGNGIHQFLQCYHDKESNPVRLVEIDTRKGTLTTRVFCPSTAQEKDDGSARTITGIDWVQP